METIDACIEALRESLRGLDEAERQLHEGRVREAELLRAVIDAIEQFGTLDPDCAAANRLAGTRFDAEGRVI